MNTHPQKLSGCFRWRQTKLLGFRRGWCVGKVRVGQCLFGVGLLFVFVTRLGRSKCRTSVALIRWVGSNFSILRKRSIASSLAAVNKSLNNVYKCKITISCYSLRYRGVILEVWSGGRLETNVVRKLAHTLQSTTHLVSLIAMVGIRQESIIYRPLFFCGSAQGCKYLTQLVNV